MQFFECWLDSHIVKHDFQKSKRSHQSSRLEIFEKFVFFEISVDCLASGASSSYFRIDLNNMTKVMLKLFIFRILWQRLHVCVFVLEFFILWVRCVSASMLLFVALLCHETWCVALIKLWWLCDRVSYRKIWKELRKNFRTLMGKE